jgi:hypothetical protein
MCMNAWSRFFVNKAGTVVELEIKNMPSLLFRYHSILTTIVELHKQDHKLNVQLLFIVGYALLIININVSVVFSTIIYS